MSREKKVGEQRRTMKVVWNAIVPEVTETDYRDQMRWGLQGSLRIYDLRGNKIFDQLISEAELAMHIRKVYREQILKPVLNAVGFLTPKDHPRRGHKSGQRL